MFLVSFRESGVFFPCFENLIYILLSEHMDGDTDKCVESPSVAVNYR